MKKANKGSKPKILVYFSDWFSVEPSTLDKYGAFNISLVNDLPLFIDPFLLFTSEKPQYKKLHDKIIDYVQFLREQSTGNSIDRGLIRSWYMFPEVRQLWLGFSQKGNGGSGLGMDFANALNKNLNAIFSNFGKEQITQGSHLEKLCLINAGVGKDCISDFTANLIKDYLLEFTSTFAKKHIAAEKRKIFAVDKVSFNLKTQTWTPRSYDLPAFGKDFVLLCPRDILTREENWINRPDMMHRIEQIARSSGDAELRSQVSNYLTQKLKEGASKKEKNKVYEELLSRFPEIIELYIRMKEDSGDDAQSSSDQKVSESEAFYIRQLGQFIEQLALRTDFYTNSGDTQAECEKRINFLKEEIENNGAYRIFYNKGAPIKRENDLQIMFRLTWFATLSDFNSEVDNGRGPVDFKISRGRKDSTLVEFKLASNTKLKQNLAKQVEIYKKANRTPKAIKVIFFFSRTEELATKKILKELNLDQDKSIYLIDCRNDNKPSASKA